MSETTIVRAATPEEIAASAAKNDTGVAQQAAPRFVHSEGRTRQVKLVFPIEVDGKEVSEITFTKLRGKDFRKLGTMPEGNQDAGMMALMSGQPIELFEELDLEDFTECVEVVKAFLPARLLGQPSAGGQTS